MLQKDTIMGSAGSARPANPQSESSEDSEPELESGKHFAYSACVVLLSRRCSIAVLTSKNGASKTPIVLIEDLTEQELEAILDDDRARAVVNQLFQQSGSGDGQLDEASSDDEDYEDDIDEDDDVEDCSEDCSQEEDEERDIRRRTFAFFGFGEPKLRKQLAKHPRLSECQQEQLVHPAAQMLNLSCAAVNGKDCLSAVHPLCDTPSCMLNVDTACCGCICITAHSLHASSWTTSYLPTLLQLILVCLTHQSICMPCIATPQFQLVSEYLHHQCDNVSICGENRLHGGPTQWLLLQKIEVTAVKWYCPVSTLGVNCTLLTKLQW